MEKEDAAKLAIDLYKIIHGSRSIPTDAALKEFEACVEAIKKAQKP